MSSTGPTTQEEKAAHFMRLALRQAENAVGQGQTQFGAAVVDRDGQQFGQDHNAARADLDPTAHGEIAAIRAAWRRLGAWQLLSGSTFYSSCEPCLLCSYVGDNSSHRFGRIRQHDLQESLEAAPGRHQT